ncbi:unnamed protein product [Coregonus sp. 'balchen']|nr:unnamed protein product [Coregonus sp. 'balchen']
MEACLDEELPPTTELEEGLRNGVYLAKLGNFFAPRTVSIKKIYDREQTRYKIFYPETTDIYDRKNMPRCIYCIHALSLYLFKLGLAPQIQDLYGKVDFTEEEINNMKSELEKYGIQMPAFSKIGGILANELSVDEAALHAAVIAINEAIDQGVPEGTMAAMQNPNAMLLQMNTCSAQHYQDMLHSAKAEKALLSSDEDRLYEALRSQALGLQGLQAQNKGWYLKQLMAAREDKEQNSPGEALTKDELQTGAVERINTAIRAGVPENTAAELMNPDAQLPEGSLSHPELLVAVEMLSSVVLINRALDVGDRNSMWRQLASAVTGLSNVEDEYAQRYMDELMRLKAVAREEGSDYLTWNDIQACIVAIGQINEALDGGDPQNTLEALLHSAAKLTDVDPSIAQHYYDKLLEARREKAHETQDPSAVLWLDEIQDAILTANKDTQEALQFSQAIQAINGAVDSGEASQTLAALRSPGAGLYGVTPECAQNYQDDLAKSVVSGVTTTYNREQLWLANESLIAKLQAGCRGYLQRKIYIKRKEYLNDHSEDAVKIQSMVRMHQARKNADDPPMAVVRKFVHLLDHSDQDFQEELDLMRLREEVVTNIRSNQQLENDLNLMDIKIGLLVKNKITLQETNPTYLAKLIFQMPQNKSTKFMDSEIVTGNPTVIKMVVSFNRGARGQNALRQILAPVVKEIMDDKTLNIKTDPVDIYKSWVNQMETQTGEASKLPYEVTPEQAMSHEEVRTRLEASIKNMRTVTDKFLYGMRFTSKVLKDTLHEKFPDATEDELLKIVGNLLYYRYMNPAIVAPDAFDIIDLSAGGQLTTDQRRNLGSIAKMLQHAASNKITSAAPTRREVINTHTLLLDHQDAIASEHNDPIHELLEDLGEVPTIESLIGQYYRYTIESFIGESPLPPGDPNRETMGKTEVSLTLANKFEVSGEANAEMDARTLLLNTKRLIVDVIRFQPGDTLTEILEGAASPEQEVEYQRAMQRRAIRDAKTPEKMKQAKPAVVDDSLTLQGKKDKIRSNLQRLAELGKVHPENRYQDLINDIAKDIRNQRRYRQRRKAELVKLQQTNTALNSKTAFYNVQIDYYNQLSKKPGDTKAKKSKQVSQKYTAARLHEKGVLIEIEDLQTNQFKNVIFEISPSEAVGVFDVKAKFMGVHLETLQLEYQDLLQLQYEGVAVMKLFDRATINVNLLIFLLNKKFYGK